MKQTFKKKKESMKAQAQLLIYPYTPIFTFLNLDTA